MVDTTRPINILGIPGSLRQASYNKAALFLTVHVQEHRPCRATPLPERRPRVGVIEHSAGSCSRVLECSRFARQLGDGRALGSIDRVFA